jgi:hypothetical protein
MTKLSLTLAVVLAGLVGQAQATTFWQMVAPVTRPVYHASGAPIASDTPHRWYQNTDRLYPKHGGVYHHVAHSNQFMYAGHGHFGGGHGCGCKGVWDGYCGSKCRKHRGCGHKVHRGCGCKAERACGHKAHRGCDCKAQRSRGCGGQFRRHCHKLFDGFAGCCEKALGCGCKGGHRGYHGKHYEGEVIEDQGPSLPTPAEKIDPPAPKADTSADQLPMWPKALGLLPIVRG